MLESLAYGSYFHIFSCSFNFHSCYHNFMGTWKAFHISWLFEDARKQLCKFRRTFSSYNPFPSWPSAANTLVNSFSAQIQQFFIKLGNYFQVFHVANMYFNVQRDADTPWQKPFKSQIIIRLWYRRVLHFIYRKIPIMSPPPPPKKKDKRPQK